MLESPPLLYEDIYPFAASSRELTWRKGIRFAPTLIGESHIKRWDGVHIIKGFHHLLAKSMACAILRLDPHYLYGHSRPPHGDFGPWIAPFGQGMTPSYSNVAIAPPAFNFRPQQLRRIPPLMEINVRRFNRA